MEDEIVGFQQRFNEVVEQAQAHCFASVARDLQVEQCANLNILREEVETIKQYAVTINDGDSANAMLSYEMLISALIHELQMWVAIKDDLVNDAWDHLISAQSLSEATMRVHAINRHISNYLTRLHVLEQLLFPPQMFLSTGLIVESSICSVCEKVYGDCDHVVGRAYMGKMCYQIVKISKMREVSITPRPVDKKCRIYSFAENGVRTDKLTMQRTSSSNSKEEASDEYNISGKALSKDIKTTSEKRSYEIGGII